MTDIYSTKDLFQLDKMNNRKLQKSQQFIPDPSKMIGYLAITGLDLGLLINFKNAKLEWKRVVR